MKLVARQIIYGINDDIGLQALDGIKYFEANVKTEDELVELFQKENPEWKGIEYKVEFFYE